MKYFFSILTLLIMFLLAGTLFAQPTILSQPSSKIVWEGEKVTLSVQATGTQPITYQWQKNGVDISGGDVLGSEEMLNGDFSSWTGDDPNNWNITGETDTSAFIEQNGGSARIYSDSASVSMSQGGLVTNKTYVYSFDVTSADSGMVYFEVANDFQIVDSVNSTGTYQGYFVAVQGTIVKFKSKNGVGTDLSVDNLTIKEVVSSPRFSTYITPALTRNDDGAVYRCMVTDAVGSTTSNEAAITVKYFDGRVTEDLVVLYDFQSGSGTKVRDVSGVGTPSDLTITTPELAVWTEHGLFANEGTIIRSDTTNTNLPPIFENTNEITIETWIDPSKATTPELSKIFTYSLSGSYRNFVIGQNGDKYEVLLRRVGALEGEPAVSTPLGSVTTSLTHLVYTKSSDGTAKLYLDGTEVASTTLPGQIEFSSSHTLALANELWGGDPWKGAYYLVALYSRALSQNEISNNYSEGVTVEEVPTIVMQPKDKAVLTGEKVTFNFEAYSTLPITYQWKRNGANIPGANGTSYTIENVSVNNDGDIYSATATNSAGTVTSRQAELSVTLSGERVKGGLTVLYTFEEGSGNVINDVSENGSPLNLTINTLDSVKWTNYGLQVLGKPSIISTIAATKIVNDVSTTNEISIEAWVKPENITQFGPSRIVTMSSGDQRNFMLGQEARSFESWIRTSNTSAVGNNVASTSTLTTDLTHVIFTRSSDGTAKFYINGEEVTSTTLNGNFSNWNPSYLLSIGNEIGMDRAFLGLINLVAVYDRALSSAEVMQNYNVGAIGDPEVVAPTELSVTVNSNEDIKLMWSDNSNNEDGFIIERGQGSPVNYSVIDSADADDSTYVDLTADPNQLYNYRLKAYNFLKISEYTNVSQNLLPPASLTATSVDIEKIFLEWNDQTTDEDGFILERSVDSDSNFVFLDSLEADTETYFDTTDVVDAKTYYYRLRAYKDSVRSGLSNIANSKALIRPIARPTDLAGSIVSEPLSVELSWTDNSNNESAFVLEKRMIGGSPDFAVLDTVDADVTTYTDTAIINQETYVYRIHAFNQDTLSENSDVAIVEVDVVGVEDELLPTEYSVSQNYPNPFNPTTSIKFALPEASKVTLKIFNLLGQEVTTLVNQNYSTGRYEVKFNANRISSGIYIYSISAEGINGNNFMESKKMTLLK